jgi:hypothetical protein
MKNMGNAGSLSQMEEGGVGPLPEQPPYLNAKTGGLRLTEPTREGTMNKQRGQKTRMKEGDSQYNRNYIK